MRKFLSALLLILIFMGITMSILNFMTKVYAATPAIVGTTTQVTGLFDQLRYYLQGGWLYGNYYCLDEPSDCAIVN
ncbi:MAG: hypothetical protein C0168_10255 [Candidatus Aminicenantes bacterium]|nr:MAG: hypothetical protein C0168_10255 [Candidatus Aminicenantes bacterium]